MRKELLFASHAARQTVSTNPSGLGGCMQKSKSTGGTSERTRIGESSRAHRRNLAILVPFPWGFGPTFVLTSLVLSCARAL